MDTLSLEGYRGVPLGAEALISPTLAELLAEALGEAPVRSPEQRMES
jgi:hypothetical protein